MRALSIMLMVLFSVPSVAQVVVEKNQPVPFDGVLLTKDELAKILAEREALKKKLKADVEYQKEKSELQCKFQVDNLQLRIDTQKETCDALIAIKDSENDRLFKQVEKQAGSYEGAYFAGGFVGGAGMCIAITYALNPKGFK